MIKWNLIIDVAQCHDCNNCFLACKDEYFENDFPPYSLAQPRHGHKWMDILRKERGQHPLVDVSYLPLPCMHCDNAPCLGEAVYQRDDGIVLIDPQKAQGRKDILDLCPYGVIWWNEEKELPQKCTLCVHLLEDGWEQPRCVQACPTDALRMVHVQDSEMEELVKSENLQVYQPQHQTKPRVYYKNLYRYTRCLLSGSVALKDLDECAEGAKVALKNASGDVIATAVTNNYGDFKMDDLKPGNYSLEVEYPGHQKQEQSVDMEDSLSVGVIFV